METNEEKRPSKEKHDAMNTLFSVNGRNQLEMIAIADNKANMITAICVALVFLIITLFSSGVSIKGSSILQSMEFVMPLGILLAFSCVSAICAILALKPKIVRAKGESKSALFFHNYYRKSLSDFKKEMHEMMDTPDMIYDHMLKDMYFNGLVLERKYALLGFSYSIFLLAIVCSVTSYVLTSVF